jgi:hypothetical protein
MLTLEALKNESETLYYLDGSKSVQSKTTVVSSRVIHEYQSRNLDPLERPSEVFADVQRLVEIAFSKLDAPVSTEYNRILSFVERLKGHANVSEAISTIGMLIFLGEKDAQHIATFLDLSNVEATIGNISREFLSALFNEKAKIQEVVNDQYYADVFDYEKTDRCKKTVLIANLLVTKDGWVNSALISPIIEHILDHQDAHQKEVIPILNALQYACTNASNIPFTEHIADVYVPIEQLSPISDTIRATILLDLEELVTSRHCRIAILTALLTHDNLKIPPSLFSKKILAERMDRFITQLACWIKHGKVTHSSKTINASWDIDKSLFNKNIKLRRTGTVSKVQEAFWGQGLVKWWYAPYQLGKIPSISQAYRMIGVGDSATVDQHVVNKVLGNRSSPSTIVTLSEVLWEAASYAVRPSTDEEKINVRYRRGVLGLLSETACPLLLVWRKMIKEVESMNTVEARYLRIQRCLESVFSNLVTDKRDQYRMKQINRICFQNIREEMFVHEGYTALYDDEEKKVDSPESFKIIVKSSINAAKDALVKTLQLGAEKEGYGYLFDKLKQRIIDSSDFSYQFAVAYDPRNSLTKDSDSYPYNTPWNEFTDFDEPTFFTAFDDRNVFKDPTNNRPKSVSAFVEEWVENLRKIQGDCQYISPLHSTMEVFMDQSKSVSEHLADNLIQPGFEVSTADIDKETQLQFIDYIKQQFIPYSQNSRYDERFSGLVKESSNLSIFSKNLLKVVLDSIEMDDGDREKASLEYTNTVIQKLLSSEQKQSILSHAIYLFPSNWVSKNGDPYHFVAFFNPVRNNVCLGTFDGNEIQALDQYNMVENGFLKTLLGST